MMNWKKWYEHMFKFCVGQPPHRLDERQMQMVDAHYAKIGIVCSFLLNIFMFLLCILGLIATLSDNQLLLRIHMIAWIVMMPYLYFLVKNPLKLDLEWQNPADFSEQKIRQKKQQIHRATWLGFFIISIIGITAAKGLKPEVPIWLIAPFVVLAVGLIMRFEHMESMQNHDERVKEFREQQNENAE